MSTSDYNKITSIIDNISRDYTYNPESNNIICIDISNSRIGINTLDPEYSLHISGGTLFCSVIRCVNLNVNKINGVLYNITLEIVNSNIIPSNNNSLTLGNVNTYWSNAYIRDLSVTSIDISKNILPLLPNSSDLGSSLKRWKTIFVDDISVNTINGATALPITISSLTNNGTLLDISKGKIIAKTISAETISVTSDILLYDISLKSKINTIINSFDKVCTEIATIEITKKKNTPPGGDTPQELYDKEISKMLSDIGTLKSIFAEGLAENLISNTIAENDPDSQKDLAAISILLPSLEMNVPGEEAIKNKKLETAKMEQQKEDTIAELTRKLEQKNAELQQKDTELQQNQEQIEELKGLILKSKNVMRQFISKNNIKYVEEKENITEDSIIKDKSKVIGDHDEGDQE